MGNRAWWILSGALVAIAIGLIAFAPRDDESATDPGFLTEVPQGRTPDTTPRLSAGQVRARLRRHGREGGTIIRADVIERLGTLRGVPVVVNQWASWCPPCEAEFGFFASAADRYAEQVAFLGLNSGDRGRGDPEKFLREHPVRFPSISDRDAEQARGVGAGTSWPTTVFFDRAGNKTFTKPGGYATEKALLADIRRYALGRVRQDRPG